MPRMRIVREGVDAPVLEMDVPDDPARWPHIGAVMVTSCWEMLCVIERVHLYSPEGRALRAALRWQMVLEEG